MALNALGALLAACAAGASIDDVVAGLQGFRGVHRRFQFTGREQGVRVFDDYAHHPTEVAATLIAARELVAGSAAHHPTEVAATLIAARELVADGGGRVIVVFQPHLYSRTEAFAAEFGAALDHADEVMVLDVYGAREEPLPGVSGALVAEAVTKPVRYQPDMSQVPREVANHAAPGDIVITMGAGDVTMLGGRILDALRAKPAAGQA
jgi:UDP-N-acetylmuramate--alanine ligase